MKKSIAIITIGFLMINFAGDVFAKGLRVYSKKRSRTEKIYDNVLVEQVISGDIIRLENGELIRLIGVDTPELNHGVKFEADAKITGIQPAVLDVMANESWLFLQDLVLDKRIRIEFDKKRKDLYGVLLGYIFLMRETKLRGKLQKNEIFVNAECIKHGYTYKVDTYPNVYYQELFDELHKKISVDSKGIWKQWQQQ